METAVEHVGFTKAPSPVDSKFNAFLRASTVRRCIDKGDKIINGVILRHVIHPINTISRHIKSGSLGFHQHACERIIKRGNMSLMWHAQNLRKNLDQLQYWRRRDCFIINGGGYVYIINKLGSEILTVYYSSDFSEEQGDHLS